MSSITLVDFFSVFLRNTIRWPLVYFCRKLFQLYISYTNFRSGCNDHFASSLDDIFCLLHTRDFVYIMETVRCEGYARGIVSILLELRYLAGMRLKLAKIIKYIYKIIDKLLDSCSK